MKTELKIVTNMTSPIYIYIYICYSYKISVITDIATTMVTREYTIMKGKITVQSHTTTGMYKSLLPYIYMLVYT